MKAVKTAVILMSIAIVAGFCFVVYTIVARMMSGEPVLASSTVAPAGAEISAASRTAAATQSFGDIDLPVPAGCELDSVRIEGPRLLITLDGLADQRCEQIIVMDVTDGRVLGRVTLRSPQ
jgi:hypothetical protein